MRFDHALWVLALVLFAALVGVAAYKAWPVLFPEVVAVATPDPGCDLHQGPCTARLPDGATIAFAITPEAIPVIQPLTLTVTTHGLEAGAAEVDFRGVDMNMGFNRPKLNAAGAGRFVGGGMLPVCVRNRMQWEARVLVRTREGLLAAPFRFWTIKP